MSCKNFETVITEIARGQMLEAGLRADTLSHIEGCKNCAARFRDEQTLTAGLRNIASVATKTEAPAKLEAALVSAFHQRNKTSDNPVVAPATRTISRARAMGIAAAAALLVVSVFAVSRLLFIDSPEAVRGGGGERVEKSSPASSPTVAAKGLEQTPGETPTLPSMPDDEQKNTAIQASPRLVERQRGLIRNVGLNSRPVHSPNNYENVANAREEVTTEFLPLTYGGLSQVDDGQVVRIEVPRSALQSFGLPVNIERAGERVKADVLLGHDGVARAIRFVR
ncbi:MAG TPA: hypothetical protein VF779_05215 [Pyrinomonadaceae bacterium]